MKDKVVKSKRGEVISYGKTLKPQIRKDWIISYFFNSLNEWERSAGVSALDSDFVDEYLEATNATFKPTMYGAFRSKMLGKDLSELFVDRKLKRNRAGIGDGLSGMGFPRSIWNYSPRHGSHMYEHILKRESARQSLNKGDET